jgi:hypothetical protein
MLLVLRWGELPMPLFEIDPAVYGLAFASSEPVLPACCPYGLSVFVLLEADDGGATAN